MDSAPLQLWQGSAADHTVHLDGFLIGGQRWGGSLDCWACTWPRAASSCCGLTNCSNAQAIVGLLDLSFP